MKVPITDIAKVIRSKNAGPYELTLDILLEDRAVYEELRDRRLVTAEGVARLYGIPVEEVLAVVYFDAAKAVKATMLRRRPSGSPGDTDVYGAQQHAPLLSLEFDLHGPKSETESGG